MRSLIQKDSFFCLNTNSKLVLCSPVLLQLFKIIIPGQTFLHPLSVPVNLGLLEVLWVDVSQFNGRVGQYIHVGDIVATLKTEETFNNNKNIETLNLRVNHSKGRKFFLYKVDKIFRKKVFKKS